MPSLTAHQSHFIASLRLDFRGNRDTRPFLRELIAQRRHELATLARIEARWDALAEAARGPSHGRAAADARQVARAAMRALSSFGMADADSAADLADSLLRDEGRRDTNVLVQVMREVVNPSRPRLTARRARLEEEVAALEFLVAQAAPKRLAPQAKRLAVSAKLGNGPLPPGALLKAGAGGFALYREANAAVVDELSRAGAVDEERAAAILEHFAPYVGLTADERRGAAVAYLRFIEARWRDLGKPADLARVAGRWVLARKGERGLQRAVGVHPRPEAERWPER